MINDRNDINAGDNSTNIQGKDVTVNQNNGLDYSEVRQIAMDVFKTNFYDLGVRAEDIVLQRAEEVINNYLDKLSKDSPESLINTEDPDVRYSIYNVQKNHARLGYKDIADLMVDLLVERTKLEHQDFMKLIMNESIEVIPKLTIKQIDTLTILFILRYVNLKVVFDLNTLSNVLSLFSENLTKDEWFYQHLQYTSCISISIGSVDLEEILYGNFNNHLQEGMNFKDYFRNKDSNMLNIIEVWENSSLKSSSLTSVGIAIAFSNFKRKIESDWKLSEWIKE